MITKKIDSTYTDASVRLGTAQTMYLLQDALSRMQRAKMCGNCEVRDKGLFWVVTKAVVRFTRYPEFNSTVDLDAGFAPAGRIGTDFCVEIYEQGEKVIEAVQQYCVLDFARRRPQKLAELMAFEREPVIESPFTRFAAFEGTEIFSQRVLPHMIDMSGHLNNVEYVKLILDCFDCAFVAENEVAALEAHFLKECKEGELLTVSRLDEENTSYCRIARGNEAVFEARLIWREKK